MSLEPLPQLILLFFLLLVIAALSFWFLLTLGTPATKPTPRRVVKRAEPLPKAPRAAENAASNDEFRGAKVKTNRRSVTGGTRKVRDDAFERFIHSKNDELDF